MGDNRVNKKDIDHFKLNGWVNINLNIDLDLIDKTLLELKEIRKNAIKSHYPFGRVYFDHLLDFNLAAIELPFNNQICTDPIKHFFKEARIGSILSSFFQTDLFSCTVARLFCMGDYKYRGNWHRDHRPKKLFDYGDKIENIQVLQLGIYLEDQKGFRILKREFEDGFEKSIIDNQIEIMNEKVFFPLQPDKKTYSKVGGKKGSILIFDPTVYHQGSNQKSRIDFHMRFEKNNTKKTLKNSFQDFNVKEHLHEDFNHYNRVQNIPNICRQNLKTRILNSINYYFPIYNSYKILLKKKDLKKMKMFGKPDFLSNTIFQKDI